MTSVAEFSEVLNCYRITGNENIIMEVVLRDQIHLQEFIDQLITYGEVRTHIILSNLVENSPIKDNKFGQNLILISCYNKNQFSWLIILVKTSVAYKQLSGLWGQLFENVSKQPGQELVLQKVDQVLPKRIQILPPTTGEGITTVLLHRLVLLMSIERLTQIGIV